MGLVAAFMHIALIGAHGKIARLAGPLLAAEGHIVDGVIRNPEHQADVKAAGMTPVVADVETMDTPALAELLAGHDAVVWSAGAGGGNPERTYAVDRNAAIRSMDAAAQAGVGRYVMVSYSGSDPDHGVPQDNPFFHYAEAKAAADEYLRGTDLDWTVLGPSRLSSHEPTGRLNVAAEVGVLPDDATVTRAYVASVIVATLGREDLSRSTVRFTGGDTPIAEALGG